MTISSPLPAKDFDEIVALRRDIHHDPELSGEEERTAERIRVALERIGLESRRIAGTGVVADIPGANDGPMIALRADLDALPIQEETGLPFSSANDGVMHACGHDGHTSMVYGAARLLVAGPPPPLPVRLIWQPAEEQGLGAKALVAAGALEGVGAIFGGHVDRRAYAGQLIVTDGPVNASSDVFVIEISGQQAHGARPHEAVDAIVVGSLLVTAIQTIVSREVDPAHPSVVSIGSFRAGSAPNVIAGSARLMGTIRAQEQSVRNALQDAIVRIANAVGQLHGAVVEVEIIPGTPPVTNPPEMTAIAREAAQDVVSVENVRPLHTANMGAEDFSYYLEEVPGCYIRFGAAVEGKEGFPAHSSRFDIDELALGVGAAWFARVARLCGERLLEEAHQR